MHWAIMPHAHMRGAIVARACAHRAIIARAILELANVTPIVKKGDNRLIKYCRLISLLYLGKIFEKLIINSGDLTTNHF